jgi:hypothetical protein
MTEQELEDHKKEFDKKAMKRARVMATVYGVLAITALISLVYAFFQNAAMDRSRMAAIDQANVAEECRVNAKKQEGELRDEIHRLEGQIKELNDRLNARPSGAKVRK